MALLNDHEQTYRCANGCGRTVTDEVGRDEEQVRCAWCIAAFHQGRTPSVTGALTTPLGQTLNG
ncbi:hypothetical protein [Streptomyces brasiliensis]|uniref:Uncharacterized protein n=1 Tax=Streptomyces brasiliensis TaxID=1954 RepID=A0A917LD99_9ACTN|nr:hypothetical protein [Streptomyces brasiliensis]GGJ59714.1 hypothetical protein GCM10010121_082970 [Streptomyces brasiliensis]